MHRTDDNLQYPILQSKGARTAISTTVSGRSLSNTSAVIVVGALGGGGGGGGALKLLSSIRHLPSFCNDGL